jgi:ribonuclease PH
VALELVQTALDILERASRLEKRGAQKLKIVTGHEIESSVSRLKKHACVALGVLAETAKILGEESANLVAQVVEASGRRIRAVHDLFPRHVVGRSQPHTIPRDPGAAGLGRTSAMMAETASRFKHAFPKDSPWLLLLPLDGRPPAGNTRVSRASFWLASQPSSPSSSSSAVSPRTASSSTSFVTSRSSSESSAADPGRTGTGPREVRRDGRGCDELRPLRLERGVNPQAPGSTLIALGGTQVYCTVGFEPRVPAFLRGRGRGWLTAEYAMLPHAGRERGERDAWRARPNGRSQEIQRFLGRALRAVLDLEALGETTLLVDCDVLRADGGTRTAAVTGAYVALRDALRNPRVAGRLVRDPLHGAVAAVSVGIHRGQVLLDLDYEEDREAEVDCNVVMNDLGAFVEIQGAAEGHAFHRHELDLMLETAAGGIRTLLEAQRCALAAP